MLYLLLILTLTPINLPIYTPLQIRHAATSPAGIIYVLDRDSARILAFSSDGVSLPPIARQGDGPGELRYPYSIAWVKNHLVIQDQHGLSLFSGDGVFAKRIPASQEMLVKTHTGMIGTGYTFANRQLPDKVGVFAYDGTGQRSKIFEVPRAKHGTMTESYPSEGVVYFVPATARMWMRSTPKGDRVFYFPGGGQHIFTIDGLTHKALDPIRLPAPPRVNKEWTAQAYQAHMAKLSRMPTFKIELMNPERYPAIRVMNLIDDTLYAVLWSHAPDREYPVLAYTDKGKPTTPRFSGHQVPRIVGTAQDQFWAIGWDTALEMANIALLKPDELDDFITRYPSPLADWKQ